MAGRTLPLKVVTQGRTGLDRTATDRGRGMKWLMWALVAVIIAIGLVLLAGKGDLSRFQRMRRM